MISRVSVRNFQSLREVDVELGRFTVIVGPSSSGKSAFLRAVRALVSNIRGKAFITTGAKATMIAVNRDGRAYTLSRSTVTAKDFYSIINLADDEEAKFTKLGGAVPPEFTAALGIAPVKGTSINFAGQFDRPYLLDDSGAEVARTLGDLTKVTILFDAAREANRRRLATGTALKTREADLATLLARAESFAALPARMQALAEAEAAVTDLEERAWARAALATAVDAVLDTKARLVAADVALEELPGGGRAGAVDMDLDAITEALVHRGQLLAVITQIESTAERVAHWTEQFHEATRQLAQAETRLDVYMQNLGTCPTCGADAAHMHLELTH